MNDDKLKPSQMTAPNPDEYDPDIAERWEQERLREAAERAKTCNHAYVVARIGHYNLLDKFECSKCGHVRFYQGGAGWVGED